MDRILVITGPTATGKSALAVELAQQFNGEIISADSRQVYRELDIGSAKITPDEMQGIPHHLIDVADPADIFTVAEFQKLAQEKIADIQSRGKLPILCGGTGMYISAVIDNQSFPEVAPNFELRAELEKLSVEALFSKLQALAPERAATVDSKNKRRIIRALEVGLSPTLSKQLPSPSRRGAGGEVLIIALNLPKEALLERIKTRIDARVPALFDEIKKLHDQGLSWERMESFGLEYRHGSEYVQGKINLEQFKEILATKTWQFVKRQITWWKRDTRVIWLNPLADHQKILEQVQDFLR